MRKLLSLMLAFAILISPVLAKDTDRIFVSNEKSHDIYVFDAEFKLIKKIKTSQQTRNIIKRKHKKLSVVCWRNKAQDDRIQSH